jgi:hexosaminidase
VKDYYPSTRFGELVVRATGCDGAPVATFPLPDPAASPNLLSFSGELPEETADGDLCMTFTALKSDPIYAVGRVQLGAR